MAQEHKDIRSILLEHNLRATAPRIAVMKVLSNSSRPLSHSEVLIELGNIEWDPATIFRNLVKLKTAGIAPVVSRADGIDRYVLNTEQTDVHQHPHFSCDDCGLLVCLPESVTNASVLNAPWAKAVQAASVQLSGQCPECV